MSSFVDPKKPLEEDITLLVLTEKKDLKKLN